MIRTSAAVLSILLTLCLATGCKHKDDPAVGGAVQVIDASKLRPAFTNASDENKAMVETTMMSIQGSDYRTAVANLDKLSQSPSVTDAQKKIVLDVKDQVEKKQAALAAAPTQ